MKVTIYVEGGGDNEDTITRCREGLRGYCSNAAPNAQRPKIVPCGGRQQTFGRFRNAAVICAVGRSCVLLVDSEGPTGGRAAKVVLSSRDGWDFARLDDHRVFLMVQAMEAWFLADREALSGFYGAGFLAASLPGSPTNVEGVAKSDLDRALKHASKPAKTKGEYQKVKHGFAVLALIDPGKVEKASPHAKLFNDFLRSL